MQIPRGRPQTVASTPPGWLRSWRRRRMDTHRACNRSRPTLMTSWCWPLASWRIHCCCHKLQCQALTEQDRGAGTAAWCWGHCFLDIREGAYFSRAMLGPGIGVSLAHVGCHGRDIPTPCEPSLTNSQDGAPKHLRSSLLPGGMCTFPWGSFPQEPSEPTAPPSLQGPIPASSSIPRSPLLPRAVC